VNTWRNPQCLSFISTYRIPWPRTFGRMPELWDSVYRDTSRPSCTGTKERAGRPVTSIMLQAVGRVKLYAGLHKLALRSARHCKCTCLTPTRASGSSITHLQHSLPVYKGKPPRQCGSPRSPRLNYFTEHGTAPRLPLTSGFLNGSSPHLFRFLLTTAVLSTMARSGRSLRSVVCRLARTIC